MGYRKGYYRKDGTYVQGHYINTGSKSNKNKKGKGCAGLLLLFMSLLFIISCSDATDCPMKTCSDFSTQAEALSTYNTDPDCYGNLDSDNDGSPCENLPN